ncbi:MAG: carboxypeptidase M32 [Ruminococcaceae bacterium]|nr:carboxypeptidase M32 [Oscillospiraceae bacterium]
MSLTVSQAKDELYALQKKLSAYEHAMGVIYYDGSTTAPKGTAENRAQSLSVLSEEVYKYSTSENTVELLEFLDSNKDELNEKEKRMVYLLLKDLREMKKIPMEEYIEYEQLLVLADDVWHKAKEESNFELFCPYLEKIFEFNKKFAKYVEPEKDPYEYCLSKYEEGLTKATLDEFFKKLRDSIVPLLKRISEVEQVDDSIRHGFFAEKDQEAFSYFLMEAIGLDLDHVGLSTTEHPFTTSLGSHLDERITTHYFEDDFACSMYSVIHEGGHALYDTGSARDLAFTVLDGGTSMSIHESQSRFYENIIGRSKPFCEYIFPYLCKFFPEQMKGRTAEELYKAVNKAEPSLIRTEADEVTYSLHVMIRYELEKRVMAGEIEVKDLPKEWNRMYKEYLGIDVPDDKHGVLQDSHWSGGLVGYFPSYALGNAYGAQFLDKMKKTVDVDKCVAEGNLKPINDWNRENIWVHGSLYTPQQILDRVLGEKFNADYYIEYLNNKCKDVYGL